MARALNACQTAAGRFDISVDTFVAQVAPTIQANGKAAGSATQQDAENGLLIAFSAKDHGADATAGAHPPAVAFASATEFLPQSSRVYSDAELAPTLQAAGQRNGNRAPQVVTGHAVVRRLTPTEAERLQGFPDGWTSIAWRGKGPDDCPDGPRYRALGNSMAVPVMRWLGLRLGAELARSLGRRDGRISA